MDLGIWSAPLYSGFLIATCETAVLPIYSGQQGDHCTPYIQRAAGRPLYSPYTAGSRETAVLPIYSGQQGDRCTPYIQRAAGRPLYSLYTAGSRETAVLPIYSGQQGDHCSEYSGLLACGGETAVHSECSVLLTSNRAMHARVMDRQS